MISLESIVVDEKNFGIKILMPDKLGNIPVGKVAGLISLNIIGPRCILIFTIVKKHIVSKNYIAFILVPYEGFVFIFSSVQLNKS